LSRSYCEFCNDLVEYITKDKEVKDTIKGVEFSYIETIAFCKECGEWFVPKDIMDKNLQRREEACKNTVLERYNES
jgi:uncharacterized protein with PIN domain